jgi:hypothetical protein
MKRFLILFVLLASVTAVAAADYYHLSGVTRADENLYKADGVWIVTQYCYHYGYGDTAILKWEGPYGPNTIIWDNESCAVKRIIKK